MAQIGRQFLMHPVAQATERHGGELPSAKSNLSIDSNRIVVVMWKQADYTDGTVVRMFNPSGKPVETELTVNVDVSAACETNFREETLGELTVTDGKIPLTFAPFEIKTVRLLS